jgi:hypothetical protein
MGSWEMGFGGAFGLESAAENPLEPSTQREGSVKAAVAASCQRRVML